MNYKLSLVAIIFFLVGCAEEKVGFSLEKEKLVAILADLHLAEEMIGKFRQEEKDSVRVHYLQDLSEIHQVDTTVIFSEIKIMQDNPELGLEIYSEVYALLETHSKTYDKSSAKKDKDKEKGKDPNKKQDKPFVKDKKNGK